MALPLRSTTDPMIENVCFSSKKLALFEKSKKTKSRHPLDRDSLLTREARGFRFPIFSLFSAF